MNCLFLEWVREQLQNCWFKVQDKYQYINAQTRNQLRPEDKLKSNFNLVMFSLWLDFEVDRITLFSSNNTSQNEYANISLIYRHQFIYTHIHTLTTIKS